MTIESKKKIEMFYAEQTSKLLGETWEIKSSPDEINWPDLIVTTELGQFGLEIREVYLEESNKGSIKKAVEKGNLKNIEKLTDSYYKENHFSIKVEFLGDISHHDQLLGAIIEIVPQLSQFEQRRIEPYNGCVAYILRLTNQFGEYKIWNYVSDKVGFVSNIGKDFIQGIIKEKSKNLAKYTKNISDVRLLLVSNRIFNSGRSRLENDFTCDTCGFKKIYYFSYPDTICYLGSQ